MLTHTDTDDRWGESPETDALRDAIRHRGQDAGSALHNCMRSHKSPMLVGQREAFPVDGESLAAGGGR